jgi:hypothetical protein
VGQSVSQGGPDERAYAWGGTAFNGFMAADSVAGAADLASQIGSIGRASQAIDALTAARAAESAPNLAYRALTPVDAANLEAGQGQEVSVYRDVPHDAVIGYLPQGH